MAALSGSPSGEPIKVRELAVVGGHLGARSPASAKFVDARNSWTTEETDLRRENGVLFSNQLFGSTRRVRSRPLHYRVRQ